LAVGRITEQKSFELLIRAFPLVFATEPRARLTIVGEGARRNSLDQLISNLNLTEVVTVLDARPKHELAAIFSHSTLLIIPSQFEPFGLVGLEAMACGCPVLAIAPTGASEYLEKEELINSYSIASLAEAICRRIQALIEQEDSRSLVRLRAKEWTWERAALAYQELYSGCMV
jgi:glycosyltransferase involved in cell wall biosynthesis